MTALLNRQRDCLDAIKSLTSENGICPTYRQIADVIGIASTSGVHRLVTGLVARGALRQMPGKYRSLEVVEGEGIMSFMDSETRQAVIHQARMEGKRPEVVIAEICRRVCLHGITNPGQCSECNPD